VAKVLTPPPVRTRNGCRGFFFALWGQFGNGRPGEAFVSSVPVSSGEAQFVRTDLEQRWWSVVVVDGGLPAQQKRHKRTNSGRRLI
jgi:hypothetical protein